MHRRFPGEVLPLVFVGQPGWNMNHFFDMLAEDTGLPHDAIRIFKVVDDTETRRALRQLPVYPLPLALRGLGPAGGRKPEPQPALSDLGRALDRRGGAGRGGHATADGWGSLDRPRHDADAR